MAFAYNSAVLAYRPQSLHTLQVTLTPFTSYPSIDHQRIRILALTQLYIDIWLEKLGLKPLTFQLVDSPLYPFTATPVVPSSHHVLNLTPIINKKGQEW